MCRMVQVAGGVISEKAVKWNQTVALWHMARAISESLSQLN